MAADSIPLNFDSSLRLRIVNGLCKAGKYQDQINETYQELVQLPDPPGGSVMTTKVRLIPNPETKAQFAKRRAAELVMNDVVAAERADAHAAVPEPIKPLIT